MGKERVLLYVLIGIGLLVAYLSATGYLNNANTITTVAIFSVFAIAVGLLYAYSERPETFVDIMNPTPIIQPAPQPAPQPVVQEPAYPPVRIIQA